MFRQLPLAILLGLSAPLPAQQGDGNTARMEPVVPEKLIPPSPVLSVEEALKTFKIAAGFVIEPVAVEPLVEKPVCLDFDSKGRMWVCEMRGFMPDIDGKGEKLPIGRITILEDSDNDGKADKRTVFLDKVLLPRAVAVMEDGILFMDEERLCWIARKGDTPDGAPVVIDSKFMKGGNVEHRPNGLLPNLDNNYYLAKSDRYVSKTAKGWALEPTAFRGQWGIARDDYGRLYHNNNSTLLFADLLVPNLLLGNTSVKMKFKDFTQLGSNHVFPIRVTPAANRGYMSKAQGYESNTLDPKTYKLISATSASGMAIYRGTNFPKSWYNNGISTEPVSNLVRAIRITEKDGAMTGENLFGDKEFLASTDERFRPVNVYNAPDGSLYLLDMYHGIIQHKTYMTTYLRKQSLSRGLEAPPVGHGRIYRIRSTSGKLETLKDISALQGLDLVKVLMHPNSWQREAAQRLLVSRKDPATIPFLEKLCASGPVVARIHAIWTLEGMGALNAAALVGAIRDTDAKLQSSALWASTKLSATELQKLGPVLVNARPAGKETHPYLIRALGPVGTTAAYDRIAQLLDGGARIPFSREAAVSGLTGHEAAFLEAEEKGIKDAELTGWLKEAGKKSHFGTPGGTSLSGNDLASYQKGKSLFLGEAACFGCHGADGQGIPNLGPPLDHSEWVNGKPEILIRILLHGMSGPVEVAGETYNPDADMPGLAMNPTFTDQNLADISTYIRNEWSNTAAPVPASIVTKERQLTKARAGKPFTAQELSK